jgi:hypothetical protein
LENIRKQAKKSKDAEWIYTDSNEIKTKSEIKSQPQPFYQRRNPADVEQVECYLHLQQSIIKGEIGTETLWHLALEK